MAKTVLIKPIISEKADRLSENLNQYSFLVNKKANKIEIKEAVEKMYNVAVESVNTVIMPAKAKRRNTKSGILKGSISGYKKALVKLTEGEEIDLFGDM